MATDAIQPHQWLVAWPHLYLAAPPRPPPPPPPPLSRDKAWLLVVLRGQAYRSGQQHSQTFTEKDAGTFRVLDSIRDKLVQPAARRGWHSIVLADVSVPSGQESSFIQRASETLGLLHARLRPLNATQLKSVVSTLEWASAKAALLARQSWRAMILLRADIELKASLSLPNASNPGCDLIVPFQTLQGDGVADTIVFVPVCRLAELMRVLAQRAQQVREVASDGRPSYLDQMHGLCQWVSDVRYFASKRFDANSHRDNNPLYRMVGRSEMQRGAMERALKLKFSKHARRPGARGICHHRAESSACHRHKACARELANQSARALHGTA